MYHNEEGVRQDKLRAHMWYNIAASSSGVETARENRDLIAKDMTPADISKAQAMARECVEVKKLKGC